MTFGQVRGLFRARLNALNYVEHLDGFAHNNIPSTLIDGSYHLEVGVISGAPANHQGHVFKMPITLRVFRKGYNDPSGAIDQTLHDAHSIYADILAPAQRLSPDANVKDIRPITLTVQPIAQSNDNAIMLEMPFEVYLIYCF